MNQKICILMAAYNGEMFIREQIRSIIAQDYQHWDLFINVDLSTDTTVDILSEICEMDNRIHLLKTEVKFGTAGKNFYDLICTAPIDNYAYVAFADQDDVWSNQKLSAAIKLLSNNCCMGYSSSITATYLNGRNVHIDKAKKQKRFDYKFESAGPGCTYVLRSSLILLVRDYLNKYPELYDSFYYHDWLCYYVARHHGLAWHIDPKSYMFYRQHEFNESGANLGVRPALKRLKLLRNGWYLDQVYTIENLLPQKQSLRQVFGNRSGIRIRWIYQFYNSRRSTGHSIVLGILMLLRFIK